MFEILLYYKYTKINDPQSYMLEHKALCEGLNLKGRIIIAKEGINGTVEGTTENCNKYIKEMISRLLFKDIDFKRSSGNGNAFPKLSIKVRDEIVSLKLNNEDINPNLTTGKYITAEELHELIHSKEEFYIIDMRNDYEYKVGMFENSLLPGLKNFRDLPNLLSTLEHLKDKKIITVCTGGVRCEKASGLLVKYGFKNVYQLFGGIVTYMEKYPNRDFIGKLYVFDSRVVIGFNTDSQEHKIISHCDKCGNISDNYVDCSYLHCKGIRHIICCRNCYSEDGKPYCCVECDDKARELSLSQALSNVSIKIS